MQKHRSANTVRSMNYGTMPIKVKDAKFAIGQIIHHTLFDYRGVIVDVDPMFCGSDQWYTRVATTHPPKDEPWYHVLVDNADHHTYVAECNLEVDSSNKAVNHPLIDEVFEGFENGCYVVNWIKN